MSNIKILAACTVGLVVGQQIGATASYAAIHKVGIKQALKEQWQIAVTTFEK